LGLKWDEFNREPTAGKAVTERLSEMLTNASLAFLILTAEDEQVSGKIQARMNVIHEVGLFQGKIGFKKAIILIEEGCEDFSNIRLIDLMT
jgi:predicted nucleotide-binding protein